MEDNKEARQKRKHYPFPINEEYEITAYPKSQKMYLEYESKKMLSVNSMRIIAISMIISQNRKKQLPFSKFAFELSNSTKRKIKIFQNNFYNEEIVLHIDYLKKCLLLNENLSAGKQIIELFEKELLDKVYFKSVPEQYDSNGNKIILSGWFSHIEYNDKLRIIKVKINEKLIPEYINIDSNYTYYNFLSFIAIERKKHAVKLYEIIKATDSTQNNLCKDNFSFFLRMDYLREKLNVGSEMKTAHFKERVINECIKIINEYTEYNISFEPKLLRKQIIGFTFNVEIKKFSEKYLNILLSDINDTKKLKAVEEARESIENIIECNHLDSESMKDYKKYLSGITSESEQIIIDEEKNQFNFYDE